MNAQLERQLIRDHIGRSVLTARYAIIACMFFFTVFTALDFRIIAGVPVMALLVRLFVVLTLLGILLVMTFYNFFKIYFQFFVSMMLLLAGGGLLAIFIYTVPGSAGFYSHMMMLMILIMTVYLFPRLRLQFAAITSLGISVLFMAVLVRGFLGNTDASLTPLFLISASMILSANMAGAVLSNALNKFFRIDFLFQRKLVSAYDTLQVTYERVQEDLQIAKKIQKNILPSVSKQVPGLSLRVYFQPLQGISGDFYDIAEIEPGYCRVFIADATGHGIQAALITMIIKSEYEMLKRYRISAALLLRQLNINFITAYESLHTYFTCFIVDIDLKENKMYYASAGHPDQVLLSGEKTVTLGGGGRIIGDTPDAEYVLYEHSFHGGDKLLIFTDGLYERVDEEAEESLKVLLEKSVDTNRSEHLDRIFASLLATLDMFDREKGSDSRHDDITIIGIENQASSSTE